MFTNANLRRAVVALSCAFVTSSFAQSGAKAIFEGVDGELKVVGTSNSQPSPNPTQIAKTAPQPPKQLGLMAWVKLVDEAGGKMDVPASRTFLSGERIRLNLRANRPGYLYVASIGSSGAAIVLYPKEGMSHPVKAGLTYEVPERGAIKFDNQPGTEQLIVVLSNVPLENLKLENGKVVQASTRNSPPQSQAVAVARAQVMTAMAGPEGGKDLLLEEDTDKSALIPAVYATIKPTSSEVEKTPITLKLNLKHK